MDIVYKADEEGRSMTENIRSFSGVHDWHQTVLVDTDADDAGNADDIIWDIEHGRCPRCEGLLPQPPEYPAGSRITACRSIPICGRCGEDEGFELMDAMFARNEFGGISSASCWPIPRDEIDERYLRYRYEPDEDDDGDN